MPSYEDINEYDLGDDVKVLGTFYNADEELADPEVVKLSVRSPDGVVTTYLYLTDDDIVRESTGVFHALIDANQQGTWYYRWWSTGDGKAAEESQFEVYPARAQ